eukprot:963388-Alexandrium_andersonii.AAC.1
MGRVTALSAAADPRSARPLLRRRMPGASPCPLLPETARDAEWADAGSRVPVGPPSNPAAWGRVREVCRPALQRQSAGPPEGRGRLPGAEPCSVGRHCR